MADSLLFQVLKLNLVWLLSLGSTHPVIKSYFNFVMTWFHPSLAVINQFVAKHSFGQLFLVLARRGFKSVSGKSLERSVMSWLDLIRAGSDLYGAQGECCPPVVDPNTFLALIAGISLITWFLQMVIVMTEFTPPDMMMGGPGRRFRRDLHKDRPAQTGF